MRNFLAFVILIFSQLWLLGYSQTDLGDMEVLRSFEKGLTNSALLKWTGNDACGGQWPHIQCHGTSVTGIDVSSLGLKGTVTPDLGKLSNLEYLGLQQNFFSGPLPSLNGLQKLSTAYFFNNNFDTIPADFFDGLKSLTAIYLDNNLLNGTKGWFLPAGIKDSTKLLNLSLTNTGLAGSIPDFLADMPMLKVLNLAYNKLGGGIPSSFKNSNLMQLQANNMLGPVLTGPIDAVGSMASLTQLWLQVNEITGPIPAGLRNAVTLEDLRLNDNQLTGTIPPGLSNLPLKVFTVDDNSLIGPIPVFDPSVSFKYAHNSFCEAVPGRSCSPDVMALLSFIGAVGFPSMIMSSWNGNDPCSQWTGIACDPRGRVSVINFPNSHLKGTLSPALANLTALISLKLNDNNLTGPIPKEIAQIPSLQLLDLRDNNLSGPPPNFLPKLRVRLQGNPFMYQSAVPSVAPSSAPNSSITHTPANAPQIHSFPNEHPDSPSSNSQTYPNGPSASIVIGGKENRKSISAAVVVVPVVGAVSIALVVSVMLFFICKKKQQKFSRVQSPNAVLVHPQDSGSDPETLKIVIPGNNAGSSTTYSMTSGQNGGPSDVQVVEAGNLVISIQVLRNATRNFSEQRALGRGGFGVVYRGILDDGTNIAVKRMDSAAVSNKASSEFQAEIAVLSKVRHRHLVALLGYCIDGCERLLVYEYLPKGALSHHLFEYKKLGLAYLNWKRRLSIALDVARAMEYLHGLAHKSFIHRDLKPSNILLDDDLRAKVSDFGLVKLAPEGKHSLETKLAGTFGYLAPEYAVTGRVTTKSDVFSFGVVLMELISGRRALDETQSEENMHLVTWFRRASGNKEAIKSLIDSVVEFTDEEFQTICTVAELAGHCTAREPYQRPDMGHAVNVLSPLVERWKPSSLDGEESAGIDLNITLPQALKKWQADEDYTMSCLDDSQASLPTRPTGFAEALTSADGR